MTSNLCGVLFSYIDLGSFVSDNVHGHPEFTIYKFKKIMGRMDFPDQFRKIIIRHKCIGDDLNGMRQSACLVINPITVDGYAALFNCTPVDLASDSMKAPT